MSLISDKLRNSAKDQPCMLRTAFCNSDWRTSVLCHGPSHLKGMGNKSPDFHAAFGCSGCHWAMDQHEIPDDEAAEIWRRAILDTQMHWIERGLIVIAGHQTRPTGAPPKKHTGKVKNRKTDWPTRKIQSRGFQKTRG